MNSISEIIDDLREGKMIVLVDDEHRENEGDLVCAAQHVTPDIINFMVSQGRGMLCVSLQGLLCDRLKLWSQVSSTTALHGTAFTVSVDAHERFGISTGVSAADRALTIKSLSDPQIRSGDLVRPGHVQPLRARDGGTLVRAGQTEGSVDLCNMAGLQPAAAIIEIMNEDGSMARLPDLENFCAKHGLKICTVADIIQYRLHREKLVQRIGKSPLENEFGRFTLIAYQSEVDPMPHVALVAGDVGHIDDQGQPVNLDEPVLVRMHSQNLLGDVFDDISQPSGRTLQLAMRAIQSAGRGAVVYLRHEGMGRGLLKQLQTFSFLTQQDQSSVMDRTQIGARQPTPGIRPPADKGAYGIGSQILRDLGVRKLRLLTNHPFHPTALEGFGLEIQEFIPLGL